MLDKAILNAREPHARRKRLSERGLVLIALVALTSAAAVDAQDEPRWPRWDRQPEGRFDFGPDSPSLEPRESESIDTGYVFINDRYLEPPYVVTVSEEAVFINDELLYEMTGRASDSGRSPRRFAGGDRWRGLSLGRHMDDVTSALYSDAVLVALAEQPLITMNYTGSGIEFLRLLAASPKADGRIPEDVLNDIPPAVDRAVFAAWLRDFHPSNEFQKRASADIAEFDERVAQTEAEIAANRRLHTLTYPLTVLGMILTGLAIGHLLLHRPPAGEAPDAVDNSPATLKLVRWSLVLVLALSCLDLVWTVLASQARQMQELNPLGSRLIHDPLALIVFKVAAICLAVGLIYALRRYRRAQLASWWACLICTLLTARWLTLNSLFVG